MRAFARVAVSLAASCFEFMLCSNSTGMRSSLHPETHVTIALRINRLLASIFPAAPSGRSHFLIASCNGPGKRRER